MLKRFLQRPRVQAVLAVLLWRYLAFTLRTTRWTVHGTEHLLPFVTAPVVITFWHERLAMMPTIWLDLLARGARMRTHVLVSRNRDGRLLGRMMHHFGLGVLHGSTSHGGQDRGGATGVRSMVTLLRRGDHVAITPDGPRGPRRQAAAGVAQIAALSGAPVLPCAAQSSRRRVLRSWDRMILPLPFARGTLVVGAPIAVPRHGWQSRLPEIEAALTEAADTADRLCAPG
jgi:lysophospholipid acyltransferase (LPLAT)-like uncharacterized protein